MMIRIDHIYKTTHQKDNWAFAGTLRNEKKFQIDDIVFFGYNNGGKYRIFKGTVIGVEKTIDINPTYIYKILLPEELILERQKLNNELTLPKDCEVDSIKMDCERIFESTEEAYGSAMENAERMYQLEKNKIDKYFSQFIDL